MSTKTQTEFKINKFGEEISFFDQIKNDLKAYNGNWSQQGFWAMVVYRFGRWRYSINAEAIRRPLSLVYKCLFKLIQVLTGIELPCEVNIGKNFRIDHFGGIVVSGFASLGDNCVIRNGVTIGLRHSHQPTAPTIGSNVDIGAGAKILGDISIGNNVMIGANAVVINDVPSNCIAVGIPARVIKRRDHV
jgi:serine O-acetyltransferase